MIKTTTALVLSLLVSSVLSLAANAQAAITEQDAQSIALDAYNIPTASSNLRVREQGVKRILGHDVNRPARLE
jgi:hypothetical protein